MNPIAQIDRLRARAERAQSKLLAWHCLNAAIALEVLLTATMIAAGLAA